MRRRAGWRPCGSYTPSNRRQPKSMSEPPELMNPRRKSEPMKIRRSLQANEPCAWRTPGNASEPMKPRNPTLASEPMRPRTPSPSSEPSGAEKSVMAERAEIGGEIRRTGASRYVRGTRGHGAFLYCGAASAAEPMSREYAVERKRAGVAEKSAPNKRADCGEKPELPERSY